MTDKQAIKLSLLFIILISLSSCRSTTQTYDYRKLAKASIKLGMDIEINDNHKLYLEAAEWIGVPYRYGGNTKRGIDCSGLTSHIYKKVYHKKLERSSEDQHNKDCRKIAKSNLKEGDLLFFSTGKTRKKVSHVGIYLKDNRFIHASTRQGVIISNLNEDYYRQHWLSAGRTR